MFLSVRESEDTEQLRPGSKNARNAKISSRYASGYRTNIHLIQDLCCSVSFEEGPGLFVVGRGGRIARQEDVLE